MKLVPDFKQQEKFCLAAETGQLLSVIVDIVLVITVPILGIV